MGRLASVCCFGKISILPLSSHNLTNFDRPAYESRPPFCRASRCFERKTWAASHRIHSSTIIVGDQTSGIGKYIIQCFDLLFTPIGSSILCSGVYAAWSKWYDLAVELENSHSPLYCVAAGIDSYESIWMRSGSETLAAMATWALYDAVWDIYDQWSNLGVRRSACSYTATAKDIQASYGFEKEMYSRLWLSCWL